jgi:hypothetical protein
MSDPDALLGNRYGNLVVIKRAISGHRGKSRWICKCDCGKEYEVYGQNLKRGTDSCGCLTSKKRSIVKTKHGLSRSREYMTWSHMKSRCLNKNNDRYSSYGGRGINICNDWLSFENFYSDMGKRPKGMTIERKNNNKGYSFENCRWATDKEQKQNMRSNHYLEYKGRRLTISQWSEKIGISYEMLHSRINRGWDIERALSEKPNQKVEDLQVKLTLNCETKKINEWVKITGISHIVLFTRWKRGWSDKRILTTPVKTKQTEYSELEYNGKVKSLSEWCKDLGLKRRIIWKRLKRGWSVQDSFEVPELNNALKLKNIRK